MSRRIRSIKPELLEDEPTTGLSDSAWRLHVSLWLLADDHGNTRYSDRYVAANVWQDTSKEVGPITRELVTKRFVEPYARSEQAYAHIRGWAEHQRIDNAGKPRVPCREQDDGSLPTWFRDFRPFFAQTFRESPRVSETLRDEVGQPPDSPLRAIRPLEGSRRDLDLDGTGSGRDLSRARAREEQAASQPIPESLTQKLLEAFLTRAQNKGGTALTREDPDALWRMYRSKRVGQGFQVANVLEDWNGWLEHFVRNELDKANERKHRAASIADAGYSQPPPPFVPKTPPPDATGPPDAFLGALGDIGRGGSQ